MSAVTVNAKPARLLSNSVSPPKVIYYSPSPYKPGAEVQKLSVQKIEELVQSTSGVPFHWIEDVFFRPKLENLAAKRSIQPIDKVFEAFMQDRIECGADGQNYVICKMDDEVGFGVFAKEKIHKGDFVGLYVGKVGIHIKGVLSEVKLGAYEFDCPILNVHEGCKSIIDAKKYGNFTRFINDLPTENDLKAYKFISEDVRRSVQKANLIAENHYFKGIPYAALRATCDIKPGEQLGFSYGDDFWTKKFALNLPRRFFDLSGISINRQLFYSESLSLILDGSLLRLNLNMLKNIYSHFKNDQINVINFNYMGQVVASVPKTKILELLEATYSKEQRLLYFLHDPCDPESPQIEESEKFEKNWKVIAPSPSSLRINMPTLSQLPLFENDYNCT